MTVSLQVHFSGKSYKELKVLITESQCLGSVPGSEKFFSLELSSGTKVFWHRDVLQLAKDTEWKCIDKVPPLQEDQGATLCEALGVFWKGMPTFREEILAKNWPVQAVESDRVVFFGGSFNPWHEGHRACLKSFPGPGTLVVVPDYNPQKNISSFSDSDCIYQHFLHIYHACQEVGAECFPGFLALKKSNPTYQWMKLVSFPNKGLLIGEDTFVSLTSWIEVVPLLKILSCLFIVPRQVPSEKRAESVQWISSQNPDLQLNFLPSHPYEHISSSALRKG